MDRRALRAHTAVMTEPRSPYAVPVESLEGVRVAETEQVQEQSVSPHPESSAWSGPQLHPFGDGMGIDVDGDGD